MFFVIEIATGDAKIAGKGIYSYETEREAIATFHQKLATAMKSDLYTRDLVVLLDENGNTIKRELYSTVSDD